MSVRIAILISGRGSNMEAILRAVCEGALGRLCEVAVVFANRSDAAGLERARAYGVPVACVESRGRTRRGFEKEMLAALEPFRPEWLVLAGFDRVLSPLVVRRYPGRIVNIHPADSTRFQGLGGYEWAFEQGLPETAITVHLVDEGVDTGPILVRERVDLRGVETLAEVKRRGLAVEHALYPRVLEQLFSAPAERLEG
jgi:phosphoribosylglycinamide formyltransferase-1